MGLNQTDFAGIGGVTKKTQMLYEKGGGNPNSAYLSAIAAAGADVLYILTGKREAGALKGTEAQDNHLLRAQPENMKPVLDTDFVTVPLYDVAASCGGGSIIHSEQIVDHLAFRAEWVRNELGVDPKRLALIAAIGDSMLPAITSGDLLLIDASVCVVRQDAIYAIQVEGVLLVKRIQRLLDGTIIIKSDNPAYESQRFSPGEAEGLRIVGRVIWMGRRV